MTEDLIFFQKNEKGIYYKQQTSICFGDTFSVVLFGCAASPEAAL